MCVSADMFSSFQALRACEICAMKAFCYPRYLLLWILLLRVLILLSLTYYKSREIGQRLCKWPDDREDAFELGDQAKACKVHHRPGNGPYSGA